MITFPDLYDHCGILQNCSQFTPHWPHKASSHSLLRPTQLSMLVLKSHVYIRPSTSRAFFAWPLFIRYWTGSPGPWLLWSSQWLALRCPMAVAHDFPRSGALSNCELLSTVVCLVATRTLVTVPFAMRRVSHSVCVFHAALAVAPRKGKER